MIDNNSVSNSMLSDNNIANDNFSKNTLVSFDGIFKGLDKLVALFFPSVRNAQVERYRAETTLFIAQKARELKDRYNIEVKPIPPKAAIPLFEKLSIEHEEIMFDLWAKLLFRYFFRIYTNKSSICRNFIQNRWSRSRTFKGGF